MSKTTKLTKSQVFALALLVLILLGGVAFFNYLKNKEPIKAVTEKKTYSTADELKVEIKNNTESKVCFSSCYPYLMQIKEGTWNDYKYPSCDKENVAEVCIEPKNLKAFAISLSETFVKPALHRLAIPACLGCVLGEQFRVDKILYSNEFEIKQ
jgi:hypothetical protein